MGILGVADVVSPVLADIVGEPRKNRDSTVACGCSRGVLDLHSSPGGTADTDGDGLVGVVDICAA